MFYFLESNHHGEAFSSCWVGLGAGLLTQAWPKGTFLEVTELLCIMINNGDYNVLSSFTAHRTVNYQQALQMII